MFRRQSISTLGAFLALSWLGIGCAIAYFVTRVTPVVSQLDFSQSAGTGLVAGFCGAALLSIVAVYLGNIPAARAGLESEVRGQVAIARELQARNARARRAMEAKSEYLAKMSHELRTPINAVIGYSEMLIEDMVASGEEEQCADIRRIHGTGQHLLAVINDILDLSKIDARKMELFPEQQALPELMSEVTSGCAALVRENANSFACDLQGKPETVVVDKRKFQQVVGKLVSAASDVVRGGEIRVTFLARDGLIEVDVSTLGGTIIAENAAHIFDDLETEAAGAETKGDGNLGLALTDRLCRLMGGNLRVDGEAKNGFRVRVQIPSQVGVSREEAKPSQARLEEENPLLEILPSLPGLAASNSLPGNMIDDCSWIGAARS